MAFSTQKDFQHVPFLNEYPQPKCPPIEGINLKTYAGTRDERAWSMSDKKKAQYLIDLVSCRLYDDDDAGDGLQEHSAKRFKPCEKKSIGQIFPNDQNERIDSIKAERDDLKIRLHESQENLKILEKENKSLSAVFTEEHQPELFDDIKRKISQLRNLAKIDENELLKMLDGLTKSVNIQNKNLKKSVEKLPIRADLFNIPIEPETNTDVVYLQNEVNSLRKEVAQLRNSEEKAFQKETVSNENQSHNGQVDKDFESFDNIKAERNALREKHESFASIESKIFAWKNDAEEFQIFKKKACVLLKQKEEEIRDCRENAELERRKMTKYFKQERENICSAFETLNDENQFLKHEICRYNCELTALQHQIKFLSNKLCEKDCSIEQYAQQFHQLMDVIAGLQSISAVDNRSLQELDSQTLSENIEELAVSTRSTLDHISKEIQHRQELETDLAQSMAELENIRRESEEKEKTIIAKLDAKEIENQELKESLQKTSITVKESLEQLNIKVNPGEDCCTEIGRLKEFITKIQSEHENEKKLLADQSTDLLRHLENEKSKDSDIEKLHDQANNLKIELASVQDKNRQLQNQNQDLNKALEECQDKAKAQKNEIKELDKRTTELLCSSEASLKEVGKLVNDISNVQDRNENLKSVLEAVDYSEKFKQEIDDLKKLLDEEMAKSKHFADLNTDLQRKLDQANQMLDSQKIIPVNNENNEYQNEDFKKFKQEIDDLKKLLGEEMAQSKHFAELNKDLHKELDQTKEMLNAQTIKSVSNENNDYLKADSDQPKPMHYSQKTKNNSTRSNQQNKDLQKYANQSKEITKSQNTAKVTSDQTFRAVVKTSDAHETDLKQKSVSGAPDALVRSGSSREKKASTNLAQMQKLHEATRKAERNYYEKEIEGHRMSNELLKNSFTKLTSKVQSSSAVDFEKEMRAVLDNFALEICKWRCEKNFKKLTKLQEIGKKILECGINVLSYKDLVYLHQKMSEAALRLKPNFLSSSTTTANSQKELICCKCSGKICDAPIIPKEKMLLEKMLILEREIQKAREDLRKSKEQNEMYSSDIDQSDSDTLRAIPNQISLANRKTSSRQKLSPFSYKTKEEEFQIPTKDRCG